MERPERIGEFEIESVLGQGGMGIVYRARQTTLDRSVALKVLLRAAERGPRFVQRFHREARAAAKLIHPNIIQIYLIGDHQGAPYFAMEYVEGEDVGYIIEEGGPLDVGDAVEVARCVAKALAVAAEQNIVHRDIKPSNIMVTSQGLVKIMDFGLAKAGGEDMALTQVGQVVGTPLYMSPEQAKGHTVDIRSDLYSLGCVLYESLSGQPPFLADNVPSLLYKHANEPALPPGRLNPAVPPALDEIVLRLMAKDSKDRYDSPQRLSEALAALNLNSAQAEASLGRRARQARARPRLPSDAEALSSEEEPTPGAGVPGGPPVLRMATTTERAAATEAVRLGTQARRPSMPGAPREAGSTGSVAMVAAPEAPPAETPPIPAPASAAAPPVSERFAAPTVDLSRELAPPAGVEAPPVAVAAAPVAAGFEPPPAGVTAEQEPAAGTPAVAAAAGTETAPYPEATAQAGPEPPALAPLEEARPARPTQTGLVGPYAVPPEGAAVTPAQEPPAAAAETIAPSSHTIVVTKGERRRTAVYMVRSKDDILAALRHGQEDARRRREAGLAVSGETGVRQRASIAHSQDALWYFHQTDDGRWTYDVAKGRCKYAEGLAREDLPGAGEPVGDFGDCMACANWTRARGCALAATQELELSGLHQGLSLIEESAAVWCEAERFDKAIALLEDYLKTHADDPFAYRSLARIYEHPGYLGRDRSRAMILYDRYLELAKDHAEVEPLEVQLTQKHLAALRRHKPGAGLHRESDVRAIQTVLHVCTCVHRSRGLSNLAFVVLTRDRIAARFVGRRPKSGSILSLSKDALLEKVSPLLRLMKRGEPVAPEGDETRKELAEYRKAPEQILEPSARDIVNIPLGAVTRVDYLEAKDNPQRVVAIQTSGKPHELVFEKDNAPDAERFAVLLKRLTGK